MYKFIVAATIRNPRQFGYIQSVGPLCLPRSWTKNKNEAYRFTLESVMDLTKVLITMGAKVTIERL